MCGCCCCSSDVRDLSFRVAQTYKDRAQFAHKYILNTFTLTTCVLLGDVDCMTVDKNKIIDAGELWPTPQHYIAHKLGACLLLEFMH